MSTNFDAQALTEPVDRSAMAEFTKANPRKISSQRVLQWALIGFFGVVVALILVPSALIFSVVFADGFASIPSMLPWLVVGIAIAAFVYFGIKSARNHKERQYRLNRFAAANNMTYVPQIDAPRLPGMIFQLGSSRSASDLVRGERPRFVEFGNYRYTTGSGKNSTTHTWGYVAVKLDVPLPNIVLDAVGNNSFLGSNLPSTFKKEQKLSLEGDFDQHFSLYCPTGYERDALYLFTPDIMARFIDNAAQLDVEIVDDWLFLYTKRPVSTLDPATWAWLFGAVGALMTKFDQWARWRDERLAAEQPDAAPFVASAAASFAATPGTHALPFAAPAGMLTPPPGVAIAGRRLKRSISWAPIVVVVILVIIQLAGSFSGR